MIRTRHWPPYTSRESFPAGYGGIEEYLRAHSVYSVALEPLHSIWVVDALSTRITVRLLEPRHLCNTRTLMLSNLKPWSAGRCSVRKSMTTRMASRGPEQAFRECIRSAR